MVGTDPARRPVAPAASGVPLPQSVRLRGERLERLLRIQQVAVLVLVAVHVQLQQHHVRDVELVRTDYCVGHTPRGLHLGAHAATALATLLAFTDGLVERRGESLDAGLDRLARAAATPAATLDGQLTALIDGLTHGASEDDIALAFRWTTPAGSGWLSGGADLGL